MCDDFVLNNDVAYVVLDTLCHGVCYANPSEYHNPDVPSILALNPIMSPGSGSYLHILPM